MRVLLDTHTFLWGIGEEARLPGHIKALLPVAECWFSVASVWEILTKVKIGKLSLPTPTGSYVTARLAFNGVQILPITLDHILRIESLDLHHRDPFDRIMIAQSLEENLPIVTADPVFGRYPVKVIW